MRLIYGCKGQGPQGMPQLPALQCTRFGAFGCQAPHPHLVRLERIGDPGRRLRRISLKERAQHAGQRERRKLPEGTRARGAVSARGARRAYVHALSAVDRP
eukprot:scaffold75019_cov66-Phaeocystis_antarctica.AAC.3